MDPRELIRAARQLAGGQNVPGQPTDAELRRAVSTAYYALFHALVGCCANLLVGVDPARQDHPLHTLWIQTYRGLSHSDARLRCEKNILGAFPVEIKEFGEQFILMQDNRHHADYDPDASFNPIQVQGLIDRTEAAITDFEAAPEDNRRTFAFYVVFDFNVR